MAEKRPPRGGFKKAAFAKSGSKPAFAKSGNSKSGFRKPGGKKPGFSQPKFKRPDSARFESRRPEEDRVIENRENRENRPRENKSASRRPGVNRSAAPRSGFSKAGAPPRKSDDHRTSSFAKSESFDKPGFNQPKSEKPKSARPKFDPSKFDRPKFDKSRLSKTQFNKQKAANPAFNPAAPETPKPWEPKPNGKPQFKVRRKPRSLGPLGAKPKSNPADEPAEPREGERLQKLLSQAGVTSRRKAEDLIREGRITVNGTVVTELGSRADLHRDHIKVDGTLLRAPKHFVYIALNKPKECVTTMHDPEGRQTVMSMMRGVKERVFPVGRLDYQSEGLLLLTNDGEFAHRITAPASHVIKTYVVKTKGELTEAQEQLFRDGIPMHGRKTSPAEIKRIKHGDNPWYEVKIAEGRQNQIRVMFKHFGKLVEKLRRVKIAFLELDVPPGRYRMLTLKEIERFQRLLKLDSPATEADA